MVVRGESAPFSFGLLSSSHWLPGMTKSHSVYGKPACGRELSSFFLSALGSKKKEEVCVCVCVGCVAARVPALHIHDAVTLIYRGRVKGQTWFTRHDGGHRTATDSVFG